MPTVEIQGIDRPVEFPDDWEPEKIKEAAKSLFEKANPNADLSKGRLSSALSTAGREFVGGVGEAISGVGRVATYLTSPQSVLTNPKELEKQTAENPISTYGQAVQEIAKEDYRTNPKFEGELFADQLPGALASTAVAALAGAVGGPVGGGLVYGLQQGEQQAKEAEAAGRPDSAFMSFLGGGISGAASEALLGVGPKALRIFKKAEEAGVDPRKVVEPLWKIAGHSVLHEAAQEGIEQGMQNVVAEQLYDPSRPVTQGVAQSALVGGMVGGIVGGGAGALGKVAGQQRRAILDAQIEAQRQGATATAQALGSTEEVVKSVDTKAAVDQLDALNERIDQIKEEHAGNAAEISKRVEEELKKATEGMDLPPMPVPELQATVDITPETTQSNADQIPSAVALPGSESPGPTAQVAEGSTTEVQRPAQAQEEKGSAGVQADVAPPVIPPVVPPATPTTQPDGSPSGVTGVTQEQINNERILRGLEAIDKETVISHQEQLSAGLAAISDDPNIVEELVDRINNAAPLDKGVTPREQAILVAGRGRLMFQLKELDATIESDTASVGEKAMAETQRDITMAQLNDWDRAFYDSQSSWGRLGAFSQRMIAYDMTETRLLDRAYKANNKLQDDNLQEASDDLKKIAKEYQQVDDEQEALEKKRAMDELDKAVDEAIKNANASVKEEVTVEPHVQSVAERIVVFLENQANAARQRLRERMGGTSTLGLDILGDYAIIGASHIARGALTIGQFTNAMVKEFGEKIRPDIDQIWEASNKQLDGVIEKNAGKGNAPKVKQAVAQQTPSQRIERAKEQIKESLAEGAGHDALYSYVQKMMRAYIQSGVNETETLVPAIHSELKSLIPDITEKRTKELMSGYGRQVELSKDEVSIKKRQIKGEILQHSKLEDIAQGLIPKNTGFPHEPKTAKQRALIKKVNESLKNLREKMREMGIIVASDEKHLKSAQDAAKTRMLNEIEDIRNAIAKNEELANRKKGVQYTEEMKALRAELEQARKDYENAFPKKPITREEQTKRQLASLDRSIARVQGDIENGRIGPGAPKLSATRPEIEQKKAHLEQLKAIRSFLEAADTAVAENEKIVSLVAKIEEKKKLLESGVHPNAKGVDFEDNPDPTPSPTVQKLQTELEELQKEVARRRAGPTRSPEEIALMRRKVRLLNDNADLERRIATGDFSKKQKSARIDDDEVLGLERRKRELRREANKKIAELELKNRKPFKKYVLDPTVETFHVMKSLGAGFEFSFIGIQGGWFALAHPIKTFKFAQDAVRALTKEGAADKAMTRIKNDPAFDILVKHGMRFQDADDTKVSSHAEMLMGRWSEKIPLNKNFHRATNVFLNSIRLELGKLMMSSFSFEGGITENKTKLLCSFINEFTGTTTLGPFEKIASEMGATFYAPRWAVSQFKLWNPLYSGIKYGSDRHVAAAVAVQMARAFASLGLLTSLFALYYGDREVSLDLRSSDLGTIKAGRMRIDFLAGAKKPINFWARIMSNSTVDKYGNTISLYDNPHNSARTLIGGLENKSLNVGPSLALTLLTGRNPANKHVDPQDAVYNSVANMSWGDMLQALKDQGLAKGIPAAIAAFFGARVYFVDE